MKKITQITIFLVIATITAGTAVVFQISRQPDAVLVKGINRSSLGLGIWGEDELPNQVTIRKPIKSNELIIHSTSGNQSIGRMILSSDQGTTKVEVWMVDKSDQPQPLHLHSGSALNPGRLKLELNPISDGYSATWIPISLEELEKSGPQVINIHRNDKADDFFGYAQIASN